MPNELVNNQIGVPEDGQTPEANQEQGIGKEPSFEELRKTVMSMTEDSSINLTTGEGILDEPEMFDDTVVDEDVVEETVEDLPDDLRGKSAAEIAKMYQNLRTLQSRQGKEIGELRKYKEDKEKEAQERDKYSVDTTSEEFLSEYVDSMGKEETDEFLNEFTQNPKKAILPVIREALNPVLRRMAKQNNEEVINRLKAETKDSIIPYEKYEREIHQVLDQKDGNGRRVLFDRFGSRAFEEAYNIVYRKHFPNERERIERELKEAREKADTSASRKRAFVHPQGSALSTGKGSSVNLDDLSFKELQDYIIARSEAEG